MLFGSTGTSGAFFSQFDYGHPANLLDHYVALRVPSLDYVDDDSCERGAHVRDRGRRTAAGLWLFYAAAPGEVEAARQALGNVRDARVQARRRRLLRRPLARRAASRAR